MNRKNPLGAVNAFRQAFPSGSEPVMLILKTRNTPAVNCGIEGMHWGEVLQAAQADWRIRIIDQTMTDEELFGLKSVIDCYVSLHRAEGFGYGPAEAMLLGKPVITTAYSGTRDFCNPQTALLVDFQETVVPFGTYPYMDRDRTYKWSEPSVEDAASKMRLIVDDPSLRERLGKAGRKIIQSEYSLDALTRRYQKRIAELGIFSEARQVAL
ncbi:MAG: glycosyltransferase family 4 protein [Bryobacteraceae bacterium]|nr:glycosyltransferase family 4 protein [Bryobacteraceae bacterium]